MLTEYQLIVSTSTWLWGVQVMKNLTSLQLPLSSVPKVAIVEIKVQLYSKIPWKFKIIVYSYICSFA